jgi:hypothetical protein
MEKTLFGVGVSHGGHMTMLDFEIVIGIALIIWIFRKLFPK